MIKSYFIKFTLLLVLSVSTIPGRAQQILNSYAEQGLKSNANIDKLNFDYQASVWALKESKKMFGPSVDITGGYTRNFRQPIDLGSGSGNTSSLLEQLLMSSSKNGKLYYPGINHFSSALQITQNIYNRQLVYSRDIKEENSRSSASQLADFRIELEAEIRTAYFQYLQAVSLKEAVERGVKNARQNLAGIQSLLNQQRLTKESLYKSRANLSSVEAQLSDMENSRIKAQFYFNFLINKLPGDTILTDQFYLFDPARTYRIATDRDTAISGYHLTAIESAAKSATLQKKQVNAQSLPVLQFTGTGGISGNSIDFSNRRLPYGALEVSFKWNIFNSGASQARSRQALFQERSLNAQYQNTRNQLRTDELSAFHDVAAQLANYGAVSSGYKNASVYYEAVRSKFMAGLATLLELLDAEYSLQQADMDRLKWYYTLQIKISTYQKQTGKTLKLIP
ncbi:Outer membrane protein TolC [Pedobacter westerhofensis]|uniref:Outer membrane protein TolC n=2 Tax=Pedobacter westerhofensis TaxID=425512 RepID=A0A521AK66_9SPHI|nr:Outer membrane protein TolC [Pedobacter westerhofensis]